MNKDKLKVAIIGYGIVGQRRRYFIDNNPNLQTVAVCDVRFNKDGSMVKGIDYNYEYETLEKQSNTNTFSGKNDDVYYSNNFNDLLENCDLDILFVALPNYLAPKVTIAGLENGLHVFCEKPPGRNIEDVEKVIEAEKKNPRIKLKYGFNHRYHGSVKKTKEIIDKKTYGKIINLRGVYGKSSVVPFTGQWRAIKKFSGGGILLDQGIHMLDMFRYFCGDFTRVKSFVSNSYWEHDVEDNVYAIMKNNNGIVAIIHSSATQWQHNFRLEITFEKGFVELSGILSSSKSYGQEKLTIIDKKEQSAVGSLSGNTVEFLEDNSWNDEIIEFADIIINDKPVTQGNSNDALMTMKLINKIYKDDQDHY